VWTSLRVYLFGIRSKGPEHQNTEDAMPMAVQWNGNDEQVIAVLAPFGVHPSTDQIAKIRAYIRLILQWNKLTSLTSITDPMEIVARHFGESMFLKSLLPVENGRLADVGSGAGFPGLALKIANPELDVILIESNKKKAAFLSEVVRTLNLPGVDVSPVRFEEMRPKEGSFSFITARAVGGFRELLRWSRTALAHRGHLALWVGGDDTTKLSSMDGWIWSPAARVPDSQRRFILVGRPADEVSPN
jgi:16S rRNA (guanine527-N7)-methyltransferase